MKARFYLKKIDGKGHVYSSDGTFEWRIPVRLR